jgi:hypothetical protein
MTAPQIHATREFAHPSRRAAKYDGSARRITTGAVIIVPKKVIVYANSSISSSEGLGLSKADASMPIRAIAADGRVEHTKTARRRRSALGV